MSIEKNTCKYRSCSAAGESPMISEASLKALEAFCSPSAAITLALASLDASAYITQIVSYHILTSYPILISKNINYLPQQPWHAEVGPGDVHLCYILQF